MLLVFLSLICYLFYFIFYFFFLINVLYFSILSLRNLFGCWPFVWILWFLCLSNFWISKASYKTNNFFTDSAPLSLVGPWRIRPAFFALFCRLANWYVKDRIWCPISWSRDGLHFAVARADHPPSLFLRARVSHFVLVFLTTFSLPFASSSLTPEEDRNNKKKLTSQYILFN